MATTLLGVLLMVASYVALSGLIGLSLDAGASVNESITLVAAIFTVVLVGLLVFDLNEGVSTLIADSDLDLLRRAPLGPGTLLAVKLIDALPRTSLLLIALAVPAAWAFFSHYPPPLWGWLLAPFQVLCLWCVPVGVGAAGALLLLRIVPARHVREGLGLISTIALIGVWLANSFLLPRAAEWPEASLGNVRAMLVHAHRLLGATPGGWLAEALRASAEADAFDALRATAKLVLAAGFALGLAAGTARLHLETVQSRALSGPGSRRVRRRAPPTSGRSASLAQAFLARDGRLIMRNWTVLADLLTTAAMWTLLPIVIGPMFEMPGPILARTVLVAVAVTVGTEIGTRTLPLERHALVWARLAPVPPIRWVLGRAAGGALLGTALVSATVWGVASAFGLGPGDSVRITLVLVPALACSLAVGVLTGAAFGDPAWTNPRAMLGVTGRTLEVGLLGGMVIVWLVVSTAITSAGAATRWTLIGTVWLGSAIACAVALRLAARRLSKLEP